MPAGVHAVLRLARAGDEGQGRLRPQGHRPRPQRGRAAVRRRHPVRRRRTRPRALHKISEIYDRIAFAAVGRYNEFENLRIAGVRYADMSGFQYDRQDVTARGLANSYAQTLGSIFTDSNKPYEVEIVVAEVGEQPGRGPDLPDHLRRLGRRRARLRGHGRPGRPGRRRCSRSTTRTACRSPTRWPRPSRALSGQPQRRPPGGQRGPARGRGAGPGPGAPQVPAAGRRPARGPADRGPAVPGAAPAAGQADGSAGTRASGRRTATGRAAGGPDGDTPPASGPGGSGGGPA